MLAEQRRQGQNESGGGGGSLILFFCVIVVCLLALFLNAYTHRRHAKSVGNPTGSLWYHAKQSKREDDEIRAKNKAEKKEAVYLRKIVKATPIAEMDGNAPQLHQAPTQSEIYVSSTAVRNAKEAEKIRKKDAKAHAKKAQAIVDVIQFVYPDRSTGKGTTRRVSVCAVDKEYLEGRCHTRQVTRTFLLHRIHGGIISLETGEIRKTSTWVKEMRRHPNNTNVVSGASYRSAPYSPPPREWQTAAYFVGFRDAKRIELENLADIANWQVRTTYSATLDVLVAGSLAGSAQLNKARSMGIEILSEDEFRQRI
ncbi:BRCT domain-containing protein [Collimonas humicola]|uniref:BRCT domain-containing protein n=1 Tax=Collimonas humicola TaxID=2825886 RepID=UPI001B8ABC75|nr:hypothetical protein [Collimonas humicola]